MSSPIDLSNATPLIVNDTSSNVQASTEGNFKGRQVINSTEEINKIINKCDDKSVEIKWSRIKSAILTAVGVAVCVGTLALIPFLPSATPLVIIVPMILAPAGGVKSLIDLKESSRINNFKVQALSKKHFIDWAEDEEIKLTFSNVGRCYAKYLNLCKIRADLNLIRALS